MEQFKKDYFNQNERMNPKLENLLKSNQLDLANNPAFPKTDASGNPINFLELISYKRFLDVVAKAKIYTNLQNVTGGGLGQLSSMLMQGVQFIQRVEAPHKQELENLAVDLVVEEMEIPEGAFQFQCKLVPVGSINQDGFQKEVEEPNEEKINKAFENESQEVEIPADELFEDEKQKRRFINMLIQGSSKKGHYMFELVRNKLNEYNPNLAETYGKVMSINDLIYWLLDDESIKQMASNPSSMAGKEEIEKSEKSEEGEDGEEGQEGGAIIKTEAICFPVSLHEIIKGVMEVFGTQGLPDDPQQANLVINAVDSLSNETMDLRLGTIVWEKFYRTYPTFILEEGNRYLQHHLFARFCALPTDEFFRVSRLIMSDDPKGAKYFAKMVDEIQSSLNSYDDTNIDDINIDDIFNYKKGGKVKTIKESDIQVGKKFTLIDGEIIEINRLFIENYDENWVEYSREGEIYENSVNNLKNFINNWRADKKESGGMAGLSEVSGMLPNPLPMSTIQPMANGGKIYGKNIYNLILPTGFYVRINPSYTATIRNLNDFENYLKRKDEVFGKQFGEITNIDKSASKEWVDEFNYLIARKKTELNNEEIIKYEVGQPITIFRNQAEREGIVIAVIGNEILVEYIMPNGTSALNIIDNSLPKYDKNNYEKNYIPISYNNARISKKWSSKIDANGLINNPQGSAKRFADGGGVDDTFNSQEIVYDMDGKPYIIDKDNHTKFKSGDMALQSSQHDMVVPVYFNENDEDADNEDFVNDTYVHVKPISKNKKSFFGLFADGGKVYKIQSKDKNDIIPKWKDDTFYTNGKKYLSYKDSKNAVKKLQADNSLYFMEFKVVEDKEKMANGGKINSKNNYDVFDNKKMLLNQANEIEHHSEELNEQVKITKQVPAWVIAKMERATTDLSDITHYLDGENKMADGGELGDVRYDVFPYLNKFIIAKITYRQNEDYIYPSKEFIYGFNAKFLEFDDINSAKKFINNLEPKYPYGVPKANVGALLLASQIMQQKQPQQQQQQQPQVVYYVPQPVEQPIERNADIIQEIPVMSDGGDVNDELINDFCITNLIELANELQPLKYYVTNRLTKKDFEFKYYKARLLIVFKEPVLVSVIEQITKFIEGAEDCHHIFEQAVSVSGSQPTGLSINLLSDKYSDVEYDLGGNVYEYPPKKINFEKTKIIKTNLGEYILSLITKDFVYFINPYESDENSQTIMYNKNGELLSDNIFATNDLYDTLINQSEFVFIDINLQEFREKLLKEN